MPRWSMATQHIQLSQELEMLFKEMADRPRRTDMVNAAKNVALDMDPWINAVKIVIKHDVNRKFRVVPIRNYKRLQPRKTCGFKEIAHQGMPRGPHRDEPDAPYGEAWIKHSWGTICFHGSVFCCIWPRWWWRTHLVLTLLSNLNWWLSLNNTFDWYPKFAWMCAFFYETHGKRWLI